MNKRLFYLLVILMSISLLGIIFVQGYWIKNSVEVNEQQFSFNANQVLLEVSERLELRELEIYYFAFKKVADSIGDTSDVSFDDVFKIGRDDFANEAYVYSNGLINQDSKLSSSFLNGNIDSLGFTNLVRDQAERIIDDVDESATTEILDNRLSQLLRMSPLEKEYLKQEVLRFGSKNPIHLRIPKKVLSQYITEALENRNLDTDFEYGVYSHSLATKVKTEDFELKSNSTYGLPIFEDLVQGNDYYLYINFPQKNKVILGSITLMSLLSVLFTSIIIVAYLSALSQLIRQRQIAEIKSDFINNMTHEFKTPIATTKLALDFLKNPKALKKPEVLERYLDMIREENDRMNTQVENILQISRLEKNDLEIKKTPLDVQELLTKAKHHMQLILDERKGYIKMHLGALKTSVLGNESHLTNVFTNILDNANKYSLDAPKIDVFTENVKNHIIIKIRDQGLGMDRNTRANVFGKFYRAHTGNVHDVKGHGLGLSYAKRMIEEHNGEITVASEKNKGSTFIIKLPIINN